MNCTIEQLSGRVAFWQEKLRWLGLGHWRVESINIVAADMPGEFADADATVDKSVSYDTLSFYFHEDAIARMDHAQLDELILHEWIHAAMRDHDRHLMQIEDFLSPAAWDVFEQEQHFHKEALVDRLSRTLYALYSENLVQFPHEGISPAAKSQQDCEDRVRTETASDEAEPRLHLA